jgi:hypothetical protein
MSNKCKQYILDYLAPLKSIFNNNSQDITIYNISDDIGKNNELAREGKNQFKFRDY